MGQRAYYHIVQSVNWIKCSAMGTLEKVEGSTGNARRLKTLLDI